MTKRPAVMKVDERNLLSAKKCGFDCTLRARIIKLLARTYAFMERLKRRNLMLASITHTSLKSVTKLNSVVRLHFPHLTSQQMQS